MNQISREVKNAERITQGRSNRAINFDLDPEEIADPCLREIAEINVRLHEEVAKFNPLDDIKALVADVHLKDLAHVKHNEISLLTMLSKVHLKALPIAKQETIGDDQQNMMFKVSYFINDKMVGKGYD
jgi:hypothetical protein